MPKKHQIPSHSGTYSFMDVPYWSEGSNSVVERITSREQFKKLVPEIVCLCCEAARRKELRKNPGATMFAKTGSDQSLMGSPSLLECEVALKGGSNCLSDIIHFAPFGRKCCQQTLLQTGLPIKR